MEAARYSTMSVNTVLVSRPSRSITVTLILCVPGGTLARVKLMPVAEIADFSRGVRSTSGDFR